jgi:hypothetical protein
MVSVDGPEISRPNGPNYFSRACLACARRGVRAAARMPPLVDSRPLAELAGLPSPERRPSPRCSFCPASNETPGLGRFPFTSLDPDVVSVPKAGYPPMSSSRNPHTFASPRSRPLDWRLWSAQQ